MHLRIKIRKKSSIKKNGSSKYNWSGRHMSKLKNKFCLHSAVTFGRRRSVKEFSILKLNETELN